MRISELKHNRTPYEKHKLSMEEQDFVYMYGLFNCKMLKFRPLNEVIGVLNDFGYGTLEKNQVKLIENSINKEVLTWNCGSLEKPDIFVFGDNNYAFITQCFH